MFKYPRKTASFYLVFSILLVLFSVSLLKAELAKYDEMTQVAENWLTRTTQLTGEWAGVTNPKIINSVDLMVEDRLVAVCYNIWPKGYIVVPVLKEMVPVKAYSDETNLDVSASDGMVWLVKDVLSQRMDLYEDILGSLEAFQTDNGPALFGLSQRQDWDRFTLAAEKFEQQLFLDKSSGFRDAGPLLTSVWHQRAPYNNLCPMGDGDRTVVGCVATAAAQVMDYWEWPPHGIGEYSYYWSGDNSCEGNTPGETLEAFYDDDYDWANVVDECDEGCTPEQEAALSELNYEVGVAFNMDYGACGSGSSVSYATNVYPTYFMYSSDIQRVDRIDHTRQEWYDLVQGEIDNNRVIQYRINRHSIVCDGYRSSQGDLEIHMNYGWGGAATAWYPVDSMYCFWIEEDSLCPWNEEMMIINIIPQTESDLELTSTIVNDYTAMSDADGLLEAGESGMVFTTVHNYGFDAQNVTGLLTTSDPYVTIGTDTSTYTTLLGWGEEAENLTRYTITVDPECPNPHIAVLNLELSTLDKSTYPDSFYVFIGNTPGFSDDMESDTLYWSHSVASKGFVDQWHLETNRYHSFGYSWKFGGFGSVDYGNSADGALATPFFVLPNDAVLKYWQYINAEDGGDPGTAWDGGIVQLRMQTGEVYDIAPIDGYPYSIIDNVASPFDPGTPCFSGNHDWEEVIFDLSAYSGVGQIIFRFGSDGNTTGEGWYIDDVEVTYNSYLSGDANGDDVVDISDAVFLVNFVFVPGAPAPYPSEAAECNCDGVNDISDAVYLVNFVFVPGSPPPADPDNNGTPDC